VSLDSLIADIATSHINKVVRVLKASINNSNALTYNDIKGLNHPSEDFIYMSSMSKPFVLMTAIEMLRKHDDYNLDLNSTFDITMDDEFLPDSSEKSPLNIYLSNLYAKKKEDAKSVSLTMQEIITAVLSYSSNTLLSYIRDYVISKNQITMESFASRCRIDFGNLINKENPDFWVYGNKDKSSNSDYRSNCASYKDLMYGYKAFIEKLKNTDDEFSKAFLKAMLDGNNAEPVLAIPGKQVYQKIGWFYMSRSDKYGAMVNIKQMPQGSNAIFHCSSIGYDDVTEETKCYVITLATDNEFTDWKREVGDDIYSIIHEMWN
jgi:hypothetical protein